MPALVGADDGAGPRLPMDDDEPPAHNRPAAATPGRHGEPRAPQAASLPPALSWAAEHEAGEILDRLAATDAGLTEREAAARLATCGRNRIAASQGPHWLASLARQAKRLCQRDADRAVRALGIRARLQCRRLDRQDDRPKRHAGHLAGNAQRPCGGRPAHHGPHHHCAAASRADEDSAPSTQERPIAELVPVDIIHLAAGDLVPADVRLLASKDLFVNQAGLDRRVNARGEIHRTLRGSGPAWRARQHRPDGDGRCSAGQPRRSSC